MSIRTTARIAALALGTSAVVTGCMTYDPYTGEKEVSKTTSGAAIGAAAGVAVGLIVGDTWAVVRHIE